MGHIFLLNTFINHKVKLKKILHRIKLLIYDLIRKFSKIVLQLLN